jgi:CRISPR/Cas system-associated protein Csx1
MATIRKRGNSYQIRVSTGYNTAGEQVTISKTWIMDSDMTEKQIEKELQRQLLFSQ